MSQIIDLDAFVPPTKAVLFAGQRYNVPGDMPMEIFLRVNRAGQMEEEGDLGAVQEMAEAVVALLTWNCEADAKDAAAASVRAEVMRRGVKSLMETLNALYKEDDDEGEPDPPAAGGTPAEDGTPSTSEQPVTEASAS